MLSLKHKLISLELKTGLSLLGTSLEDSVDSVVRDGIMFSILELSEEIGLVKRMNSFSNSSQKLDPSGLIFQRWNLWLVEQSAR